MGDLKVGATRSISTHNWLIWPIHSQQTSVAPFVFLFLTGMGWPRSSGWPSRTRESSDYGFLLRNLHASPSVLHFAPKGLSLPSFFFWSAQPCRIIPKEGYMCKMRFSAQKPQARDHCAHILNASSTSRPEHLEAWPWHVNLT